MTKNNHCHGCKFVIMSQRVPGLVENCKHPTNPSYCVVENDFTQKIMRLEYLNKSDPTGGDEFIDIPSTGKFFNPVTGETITIFDHVNEFALESHYLFAIIVQPDGALDIGLKRMGDG